MFIINFLNSFRHYFIEMAPALAVGFLLYMCATMGVPREVNRLAKRIFLSTLLLVLFLAAPSRETAAYPQFLGNKVACLVSGEVFDIERDSKKTNHEGKVYYFCCLDCLALFKANPKKYLQTVEEKKGGKKRSECKGK